MLKADNEEQGKNNNFKKAIGERSTMLLNQSRTKRVRQRYFVGLDKNRKGNDVLSSLANTRLLQRANMINLYARLFIFYQVKFLYHLFKNGKDIFMSTEL